MVVPYSLPEIKITVTRGGTDYQLEGYSTLTDIIRVENGVSQAIIRAADTNAETFLGKADIGDNVKIEMRFADETSTWTQVFGGWVWDLNPTLDADQGEIVTITARGYGLALAAMPVGEEYGSESANSSLNTIKEILTDASSGIIDKWVEKVLNTADNSEYTITTAKSGNDTVANVTSDFRYLYWPYKPALKCLEDMLDLISAASATGAHWIIVPEGTTAYLCLDTIGNHSSPEPAGLWPTWWNTDQAGSTIEVKKDMIVSSFKKQRSDANYVLYYGKVLKPLDLDVWSNNNSSSWACTSIYVGLSDDASGKVDYAIKMTSQNTGGSGRVGYVYYPSTMDLALDLTAFGGKYNVPILHAWRKIDATFYGDTDNTFRPSFLTSTTDIYTYLGNTTVQDDFPAANTWTELTCPIGPYWEQRPTDIPNWQEIVTTFGSPDWSNINAVGWYITVDSDGDNAWVDNMYISGSALRGARDDTKIGTQKAAVRVLVDDVAKDDTLACGTPGTTDLGILAQLTKAELLRRITTPIIGTIIIPGKPTILPGQLAHIRSSKQADGTFRVDSDMRILTVHQRFAPEPHGLRTYLTLTDDVTNSRALPPSTAYNLLAKATNPDYQTRERASLKARDIDITQTILSENYST